MLLLRGLSLFFDSVRQFGDLVLQCDESQIRLTELPISEYRKHSELFDEDVKNITAKSSASARDNPGGTAPGRVAAALIEAKKTLEAAEHGF